MQTTGTSDRLRRTRGVTAVEVLVVLTLVAVVVAVAAPGMRDFLVRSSVAAGAEALVEALNTARMEALSRNAQVTICKSSNPHAAVPTCAGNTADWPEGWIIFVDQSAIGALDSTDRVIAGGRADGRIETVVETPTRLASVTFNPLGPITGSPGTVEIRLTSALSDGTFERVICLSVLGRASVTRSGVCQA
ncbi:hypothetical protein EZ313_14765 [Ramlibacter henchirensis]|uniref:Type II secretion system protein H n=1 Tax=Ramlibacter henchirensis TaxID=204072 RepID=A0A4Z0BVX6_9BURK|nr:GspH/FimT family protein [Ramlibacter henchirensis]TFZ02520.1 hypothetical protein EZ313_14765 [Ramlibacter henchirensis]